nr:uncharacterized protein LOC119178376 [Rhipicephalus microplus]XP_037285477.1 uncharacterized protein LOC119178376 [Rhipicephalus microplus]
MKVTLFFVAVALVLTATHGNLQYRQDEVNEDSIYVIPDTTDDATSPYWKKLLGLILEQLGRGLQQSAEQSPAAYTPEDTAYFAPEDITIQHIRRIANLLNKVADSVEKGEKVYLFD